jgi:enoyl-CoA hydratase
MVAKDTHVKCVISEGIAQVTISRPEKLNALSDEVMNELTDALSDIAETSTVRVVVLAGEGRAFCAGYDLTKARAQEPTPQYWQQHFGIAIGALRRIWTLPQPVIAKVRGACLGGGFNIFMACDLAYASDDAVFGEPEVRFGLGTMFALHPWLVGMRQVNEILLTGRFISAKRAFEIGLINEVVLPQDLDSRVDAVSRHMALIPTQSLSYNKKLSHRIYEIMGAGQAMDISADVSALAFSGRASQPSEFDTRKREEGFKAALSWHKERFRKVGAFPE